MSESLAGEEIVYLCRSSFPRINEKKMPIRRTVADRDESEHGMTMEGDILMGGVDKEESIDLPSFFPPSPPPV
jgi:hypothetical protein